MIVRLQLLLVCVLLIALGISSRHVRRRRAKRALVAEEGLYGVDSKVHLLNRGNFDNVYGTKNAWLVEFYANWCGHCQRFAPLYSALAQDVEGWKDVVKIAAIDCAATINSALCRDHDISHYPSLRFFHAQAQHDYKGMEVTKKKTTEELRQTLVNLLIQEQEDGRGADWPNLLPDSGESDRDFWEEADDSVKYIVVINEEASSSLGAEVILDLHKAKGVLVKRGIEEDSLNGSPSIVIHDVKGQEITLGPEGNTREDVLKSIKTYLLSKGIRITTDSDLEFHNIETTTYAENPQKPPKPEKPQKPQKPLVTRDPVYLVDLENALKFSLEREIASKSSIDGESLTALSNYLEVLAKYFPFGKNGIRFLEHLRGWVSDQSSVTGEAFLNRVQQLKEEMAPVFRSREEWLGCKGSTDTYRGYPCGLWTMFHSLTTIAVLENGDSDSFNSLEVLDAMVGYVKHLFSCSDCSQHFLEMAEESLEGNVTNPDDAILWLWRAHNSVNKRLAGDKITEDPKYPKIQFPSEKSCPQCRDESGEWVENEVLAYLKEMYDKESLDLTRWNETSEEMPPAASQAPEGSSAGSSSLWTSLCLPLLLTALAAIIVLVVLVSV